MGEVGSSVTTQVGDTPSARTAWTRAAEVGASSPAIAAGRRTTSAPADLATSAISSSSVDTTTRSSVRASRAVRTQRATSGSPSTRRTFLRGTPFDPPRAGMTPSADISGTVAAPSSGSDQSFSPPSATIPLPVRGASGPGAGSSVGRASVAETGRLGDVMGLVPAAAGDLGRTGAGAAEAAPSGAVFMVVSGEQLATAKAVARHLPFASYALNPYTDLTGSLDGVA